MPKLTDEQLFIKEPYRSIIYLFFKKNKVFEYLTATDFLKEINITSDALDKCLKVLMRRNWIEIKKGSKARYYKYCITPFFFAEDIKRNIKENLDLYNENIIVDYVFNKKMQSEGFNNKPILGNKKSAWVLFGLPSEFIDYLTQEDKIILNNKIKNIIKNLEKIADIKLKYVKKEIEEKKEEKIDSKTFFNLSFNLYNISFYYRCTSFFPDKTILKKVDGLTTFFKNVKKLEIFLKNKEVKELERLLKDKEVKKEVKKLEILLKNREVKELGMLLKNL